MACEVALEHAACFSPSLPLADAALDVGLGAGVAPLASDGNRVQGAVQSAVAVAVEAVALLSAAAGV